MTPTERFDAELEHEDAVSDALADLGVAAQAFAEARTAHALAIAELGAAGRRLSAAAAAQDRALAALHALFTEPEDRLARPEVRPPAPDPNSPEFFEWLARWAGPDGVVPKAAPTCTPIIAAGGGQWHWRCPEHPDAGAGDFFLRRAAQADADRHVLDMVEQADHEAASASTPGPGAIERLAKEPVENDLLCMWDGKLPCSACGSVAGQRCLNRP